LDSPAGGRSDDDFNGSCPFSRRQIITNLWPIARELFP
jgi:hypothetical protein